jgi:3-hydroxyacyl-CoA dehydrogenase
MSTAHYALHGSIATLSLDNPPVNGLGHALRSAIVDGLQRAALDPQVHAVILIGSHKAFCGGADIREFNTPKASLAPTLRDVNVAQDEFQKPLVAAIGGFALGGGLELALACHYRVALRGAQLGLPEVKLGIIPGSGGTQRLPRLIPLADAVQMMVSGNPARAKQAKAWGLVDELVEGDLLQAALAYARTLVAQGRGPRRVRDLPVRFDGDAQAFVAELRLNVRQRWRGYPAPLEIAACAEAALFRPFDEARQFERSRFEVLVNSAESKALRHAFFAERQTSKIPDLADDTPVRDIRRAAVIGAGLMGSGIAMCFANAGIPVTLIDTKKEALERGLENIRKNYAASVSRNRLTEPQMNERMQAISSALDLGAAGEADVVVEAVYERMDLKQDIFRLLDRIAKPGAILATNTSTLDVDAIAAVTGRPQDVLGMHFFSPANVMRLLEVVRGERTGKDVLASAMKLGKALGKLPVVARVCDGFIGNRMLEQYVRQSLFLLDEGATPQQVDQALQAWGFAMGPFAMYDMAGNDIGREIRQRRAKERPELRYSALAERICERGRFGQKSGKGWHRYEPGSRAPLPDPEVDALLAAHRAALGVTPRTIGDAEIVERCLLALVNEGAQILDEGVALRASDIDMVYLAGYGFPPYRGGPMFYADNRGLKDILESLHRYADGYEGAFWQPAPLLERLAGEGGSFGAFRRAVNT